PRPSATQTRGRQGSCSARLPLGCSAWVDFFTYWASFTPGGQSAVFSEMTARPAEPNGAGGAGHPPKVKAQAWAEREATALNAVRLNRRASSDESDADAGSRRAVNGVSPEIVDAQWKKLKSVGQRSAELAAEKPAQPPVSSRQKPAASTPKPVASSKREAAFGAGASTSATKRSAPGDTAEAEVAPASKPAPKTRRKSTATLRVVSNEPAPEKAKTPARKRVAKAAAKPVEPEGPRKPKRLMKKAPAKSDDLKQIRGIGPGLEKTLNGLGIYKFSQIAAMGKPEIEWVESHLQKFQGRAERDDWVGQASKLAR
ncbi:MAG: hypothetical protein AAFV62_04205, partial [Pseudomonadota bacterium]